jgi:hypothetical protein
VGEKRNAYRGFISTRDGNIRLQDPEVDGMIILNLKI